MSHFYKFLLYLLCLYASLQICLALAAENEERVGQSVSATNEDEEDPVYLVQRGYRPAQHTLAKYVVSVRRMDKFFYLVFGSTHSCGGVILNPKLILTATHCLIDFPSPRSLNRTELQVVAGTLKRLVKTAHTQLIAVRTVIVHNQFSTSTFHNDIGLIQLKSKIDLDDTFAQAIPLPQSPAVVGAVCTTLGWGRLYWTGPFANEILYLDVTIYNNTTCRNIYSAFFDKQICAGDPIDKEKDVCVGDSGGPLICNGSITGIVSYANSCGDAKPTVYTDVFWYIDWINIWLSDLPTA